MGKQAVLNARLWSVPVPCHGQTVLELFFLSFAVILVVWCVFPVPLPPTLMLLLLTKCFASTWQGPGRFSPFLMYIMGDIPFHRLKQK